MKFIGMWILCLFIGKDRVRGNDDQCQGKCNEPQISNGNGTLLLVPESTIVDHEYDEYDYEHFDYGGVPNYDSGTVMSVQCIDSYWFKGTNQRVGSIRCGCQGRWDPGVNEACVVAKCEPTPQFGGVLKTSSSCFADSADLTAPVAANNSACLHCLPGFKIAHQEGLKDSIEVQCGTNGKWNIPAQCENQIACTRPLPSERTNTYSKIKDNFDATLQMEFECIRPDVMVMYGDPVVKCFAGHWSVDPLPVCRHKYSCLLDIQHGHVEKSSASTPTHGPWARHRDSGKVTCDQGYESITDDDTITCNKGKWQPAPHCLQSAEGFRCNFDNDICKWTHDPSSDLNWTRHQGETPNIWTGPRSDHTSSNGHYMLMSSSRPLGEKARLKSPKLGSTGLKCFEFYFNKCSFLTNTNYASTLKVYVGNATQPVFSDKGFHNIRTWIHQRIDVFGYPGEKIIIEGVVGPSIYSDIAIDDVSLTEGRCPPSPVCSDTDRSCPTWKINCHNNASVRRDCKKTCGLCQ